MRNDRLVRRFFDSTFAGFHNHECCILLEDVVVTLLISLAKIASRYRLSDSEMVELPDMNFHGYNQISEPPRLES